MTPEDASQKFHWVKYDEQNKIIELFLDHHMLSTLRTCEAKFQIEHILNIRPKGHGAWNLVFGAFLHSCLEVYYKSIVTGDGTPLSIIEFLDYGKEQWNKYNLEFYKDKEDQFDKIGGLAGTLSLLTQYYAYYLDQRLRIVDTEITFGFQREVPLGEFKLPYKATEFEYGFAEEVYKELNVKCYLTGRIDLLVDNGYKIGVIDHKTHASFRGDEWRKYNPNDAVTGYICAINALMSKQYPAYFKQGRQCLSAWIYHISKASPSKNRKTGQIGPRFKATPIDKSLIQIEEFKLRQLETFKVVAELLFNNKIPQWSTNACGNIYQRTCEYVSIHEAPSMEWGHLITDHYNITEPWNPLSPDNSTIVRDNIVGLNPGDNNEPANNSEGSKESNTESVSE